MGNFICKLSENLLKNFSSHLEKMIDFLSIILFFTEFIPNQIHKIVSDIQIIFINILPQSIIDIFSKAQVNQDIIMNIWYSSALILSFLIVRSVIFQGFDVNLPKNTVMGRGVFCISSITLLIMVIYNQITYSSKFIFPSLRSNTLYILAILPFMILFSIFCVGNYINLFRSVLGKNSTYTISQKIFVFFVFIIIFLFASKVIEGFQ